MQQAALQHNKELLQLIQLACKSDRAALALDAATLLSGQRAKEAAAKLAARYQMHPVAEAIFDQASST